MFKPSLLPGKLSVFPGLIGASVTGATLTALPHPWTFGEVAAAVGLIVTAAGLMAKSYDLLRQRWRAETMAAYREASAQALLDLSALTAATGKMQVQFNGHQVADEAQFEEIRQGQAETHRMQVETHRMIERIALDVAAIKPVVEMVKSGQLRGSR